MRPTLLFFLWLAACLALAALLTPPLVATGWIAVEPHRLMSRLAQVLILLGVWPLLRLLDLADARALGHGVARPVLWRALGLGWLLGALMLLALVLALLALGARVPDPTPPSWLALAGRAVQALLAGLLIGLLEETFFRGALHAAIRRRRGLASAAFWSALLYALVHFMKPGALPAGAVFDAAAAWAMFAGVFVDALEWRDLDSLAALFMAGVLLSLVRERTGHLGWCIGLHAGWVFVIQMARQVTDHDAGAPLALLAGDYDGVIGWLGAAWIGVLALLYWAWPRASNPGGVAGTRSGA